MPYQNLILITATSITTNLEATFHEKLELIQCSSINNRSNKRHLKGENFAAWKVSVFGVILVRIQLFWIRRDNSAVLFQNNSYEKLLKYAKYFFKIRRNFLKNSFFLPIITESKYKNFKESKSFQKQYPEIYQTIC